MAVAEALALVSAGSSITGGIFSALGGSSELSLANEQAALIDEQAKQVRLAGDVQKHKIRYAGRRALGSQIAAAGAGGVVAYSGSAADRMADIQAQVDEDLVITEYNSKAQAAALRTQAGLIRRRGAMAETAGIVGGAFSALGGLTRAGTYYYGNIGSDVGGNVPDVWSLGASPNFGIRTP